MSLKTSPLFRIPQPNIEVDDVPGFHYQGMLDTWVIVREIDKEALRKSLPDFVGLMPNEAIPEPIRPAEDAHPVLFLCGQYYKVNPVPKVAGLPSNLKYEEAACVVPYACGCGDHPCNYPTELYLQDPRGVLLGWVGAINKYFANLEYKARRRFSIDELFDFPGTPLVKLTERRRRSIGKDAQPRLDAIREIFTHPVLGSYTDSLKKSFGLKDVIEITFIRVCEELHYELGSKIKATDLELIIDEGFAPPIGVSGLVPGIDKDKFGAFWVQGCKWSLHPPELCESA